MELSALISLNLNMTSRERLLLVADIIVAHPERWDQAAFYGQKQGTDFWGQYPDGGVGPTDLKLEEIPCGTTMCVGGWAIALTPKEEVAAYVETHGSEYGVWSGPAADCFGFEETLADAVFFNMENNPRVFADVLRRLADLPDPRSLLDVGSVGLAVNDLGDLVLA